MFINGWSSGELIIFYGRWLPLFGCHSHPTHYKNINIGINFLFSLSFRWRCVRHLFLTQPLLLPKIYVINNFRNFFVPIHYGWVCKSYKLLFQFHITYLYFNHTKLTLSIHLNFTSPDKSLTKGSDQFSFIHSVVISDDLIRLVSVKS